MGIWHFRGGAIYIEVLVFIVRKTWVLRYFPFATSILRTARSLFSTPTATPTNAMLGPGPYTTTLLITVANREKKPLKQYGAPLNSIDLSKYSFFDSLVTFKHYFTGNGKVSCILATISD